LGFILPKTTHPDDVRVIDRVVTWIEEDHGVAPGRTWLAPGFETAYAFRFAYDVAASSPRVRSASISTPRGGDVERALGYRWDREGRSTVALRSFAALSLRAAGVRNLLAGLWTDVADLDGLRAFATESRAIGFTGMTVIHPSHLPIVHDVFRPDEVELDYHRRLLQTLEEAMAEGRAAVVFEGSMIDIAMIETSRRILAAATESRTESGSAPSPSPEGDT
jgi:citrate lyase subunit beta/citryl-CoA lyase